MLRYAIPILASLNEEETVKFYSEKFGFTFHSSWEGHLIFSRNGVNIHFGRLIKNRYFEFLKSRGSFNGEMA